MQIEVTENGLDGADEVEEVVADVVDGVVGEFGEGNGAVEATPGGGPVFQFVGGAEGAAEVVGAGGELGGGLAAPFLRSFDMQADFKLAGLAHGPDFVMEMRFTKVNLEGGEDDAADRFVELAGEDAEGALFDAVEEISGAEARRGGHVDSVSQRRGWAEGVGEVWGAAGK